MGQCWFRCGVRSHFGVTCKIPRCTYQTNNLRWKLTEPTNSGPRRSDPQPALVQLPVFCFAMDFARCEPEAKSAANPSSMAFCRLFYQNFNMKSFSQCFIKYKHFGKK